MEIYSNIFCGSFQNEENSILLVNYICSTRNSKCSKLVTEKQQLLSHPAPTPAQSPKSKFFSQVFLFSREAAQGRRQKRVNRLILRTASTFLALAQAGCVRLSTCICLPRLLVSRAKNLLARHSDAKSSTAPEGTTRLPLFVGDGLC